MSPADEPRGGETTPSWVRVIAILALAGIAAGYVWLLLADLRFTSAKLWPFDSAVMLNWVFIFLPWLFHPLPLVGFWLLFEGYRRGGGKWLWRWLLGAFLIFDFPLSAVDVLTFTPSPNTIYLTEHPKLGTLLIVLAIIPLWFATAPPRRAN